MDTPVRSTFSKRFFDFYFSDDKLLYTLYILTFDLENRKRSEKGFEVCIHWNVSIDLSCPFIRCFTLIEIMLKIGAPILLYRSYQQTPV